MPILEMIFICELSLLDSMAIYWLTLVSRLV
jgi:hypothetical protein